MTATKERVKGHYEVEEVPYGKVYKWTAGHALVECDCGQLLLMHQTDTTATCPECGADYAGAVDGLEGKPLVEEEVFYPEYQAFAEWQREEKAHPEYNEWLEWQALE